MSVFTVFYGGIVEEILSGDVLPVGNNLYGAPNSEFITNLFDLETDFNATIVSNV